MADLKRWAKKMIILLLIPILFLAYLVMEEQERRAATPEGPRWSERVRKSAKGKRYFFIGILVGCVVQATRGKHWLDIVLEAALMLGIVLFIMLHEATLSLPRSNEKA